MRDPTIQINLQYIIVDNRMKIEDILFMECYEKYIFKIKLRQNFFFHPINKIQFANIYITVS